MMSTMRRSIVASAACSLALGLQLEGGRNKDPTWDKKEVQNAGEYESDFVKDDREVDPGTKPNVVHSHAAATTVTGRESNLYEKGTAPWFKHKCQEINDRCKIAKDNRLNMAKQDLEHFADDCARQKKILADMKDHHDDQKADVHAQKKDTAAAKEEVEDAKVKVQELAHCPPDLEAAKAELARLKGLPNHTPADIEAECDAEKVIVEKQKCVDELRKAEAVLAAEKADHAGEKADLATEKEHVAPAEEPIPMQEKKVAQVCAALDNAKLKPIEGSVLGIESTCQAERDELMSQNTVNPDDLYQIYLHQKRVLEGKEEAHNDEKGDVVEQKAAVAKKEMGVNQAKVAVSQNEHCPPELAAAKKELSGLRAIANKVPADIDAECKAENVVLEKQKCVDVLREAEAVLARKASEHQVEASELTNEKADVVASKAALPPQEQKTAAAKAAWLAAKALHEAAHCSA